MKQNFVSEREVLDHRTAYEVAKLQRDIAQAKTSLGNVGWGSLPYVLLMILGVVLLTIFPQIALWLPKQMF